MRSEVPSGKREFAKKLRANATDAERTLWSILRAYQLKELKFRRQVPFQQYILDFVCYAPKLVIEVDGGQHSGSKADEVRDQALKAQGFASCGFGTMTCSAIRMDAPSRFFA